VSVRHCNCQEAPAPTKREKNKTLSLNVPFDFKFLCHVWNLFLRGRRVIGYGYSFSIEYPGVRHVQPGIKKRKVLVARGMWPRCVGPANSTFFLLAVSSLCLSLKGRWWRTIGSGAKGDASSGIRRWGHSCAPWRCSSEDEQLGRVQGVDVERRELEEHVEHRRDSRGWVAARAGGVMPGTPARWPSAQPSPQGGAAWLLHQRRPLFAHADVEVQHVDAASPCWTAMARRPAVRATGRSRRRRRRPGRLPPVAVQRAVGDEKIRWRERIRWEGGASRRRAFYEESCGCCWRLE
jgi:hypothetical protein